MPFGTPVEPDVNNTNKLLVALKYFILNFVLTLISKFLRLIVFFFFFLKIINSNHFTRNTVFFYE